MKLAAFSFMVLILNLACVSRYGAINEKIEGKTLENNSSSMTVLKRPDKSKYQYKDVDVYSNLIKKNDYNRVRSHHYVDYFSKKLSMKEALNIKKILQYNNVGPTEKVEFIKSEQDVDFYIYKKLVEKVK